MVFFLFSVVYGLLILVSGLGGWENQSAGFGGTDLPRNNAEK
jgi:hypothetical protein